MKRLFSALALAGAFLLVPAFAIAQTTTITASNIKDVGGNPVTGSFCVTPAQQFVAGGGGNIVPTQVCYPVVAGGLQSGVSLYDTSLTTPLNVCYLVAIKNPLQTSIATYPCFQPRGTTYSFDAFVSIQPRLLNLGYSLPQFLTNGVANSIQSSLNFIPGTNITLSYSAGGLTINSSAGGGGCPTTGCTFTGNIASPATNSILNAQLASGSTPEQQIENAAATLPNAGMEIVPPSMNGGNWNDPVFPTAPAGVTIWDMRQLNRASNLISVNLGGVNQLSYGFKIRTQGQSSASGNSYGITSCSVASNVATVTASTGYSAGNLVWIWQLSGGCAFLNNTLYGLPYTVLSVTGTTFTVAITHANLSTTSDFGQTGIYETAGYGILADVTLSGDSPNISALGGFCATSNSGCTYGINFGNASGYGGAGIQGDLGPGLLGGEGVAGTTGGPTGGSVANPQYAVKGYANGTTSGYASGGGFWSQTAPALYAEQDDTSTSANTKYISKMFSQQPNGAMHYLAPYNPGSVGSNVWSYGVTGSGALDGLPAGYWVIQLGDVGKQLYIDPATGNTMILGSLTAHWAQLSVSNINAITSNWTFYTATAATGGVTVPAAGSAQTFSVTCPWNSSLTNCMELTDITQSTSTQTNILAVYKGITPNNNHTTFTNSFNMYYTGTPSSLEFDVPFFNTQTQTDCMFGVQCNLVSGHLQIDNQNTAWKDATGPVSCSALTANAVHAISYTVHYVPFDTNGCTSMACLSFDSFTLDGVTSTNLGTEPANTLTFGYSGLEGPQFQIDIGATAGTPKTVNAYYQANTFSASSSCLNGVCSPVSIGYFTLPAGSTTTTVTSPYVTANSIIEPIFDSSLSSRLGVTCNTTNPTGSVSSRTPGASFVFTGAAPTTNPACYGYRITY